MPVKEATPYCGFESAPVAYQPEINSTSRRPSVVLLSVLWELAVKVFCQSLSQHWWFAYWIVFVLNGMNSECGETEENLVFSIKALTQRLSNGKITQKCKLMGCKMLDPKYSQQPQRKCGGKKITNNVLHNTPRKECCLFCVHCCRCCGRWTWLADAFVCSSQGNSLKKNHPWS